jgi:Golgi nucleoside diphosphatase
MPNENVNEYVLQQLKQQMQAIGGVGLPEFTLLAGNKSYTINKRNIFICLRHPVTQELYSFNTLLYVALHELAHVLSKTYSTKNHNDEFYKNFHTLLKRAESLYLLPVNYEVTDSYCNVSL